MNSSDLRKILTSDNDFIFIVVYSVILIGWMISFNMSIQYFNIPDILLFGTPPSANQYGIFSMIVFGIILAPLFETLIFQTFILFLLSKIRFFRNYKSFIIITSALLFAAQHIYSVQYMIYTFFVGIILMYAYIISTKKKPYLRVFLIHAMVNTTALLFEILDIG